MAAAFGPPPGGQSGPLIILDPDVFLDLPNEFLCAPLPPTLQLNPALVAMIPAYVYDWMSDAYALSGLVAPDAGRWPLLNMTHTVAGSILVASRSTDHCTFEQKAFYAQQAGAAGLVVADAWNSNCDPTADRCCHASCLTVMGPDSSFPAFLVAQLGVSAAANWTHTIPSVYVSWRTFYNAIVVTMFTNLGAQASYYMALQRFLFPQGNPPAPASNSTTAGGNSTGGSSSGGGDAASSTADYSAPSGSSSSTAGLRRRLLQLLSNSSSSSSSSGEADNSNSSSSSSGGDGGSSGGNFSSSTGGAVTPVPGRPQAQLLPFVPVRAAIDQGSTADPNTAGYSQ